MRTRKQAWLLIVCLVVALVGCSRDSGSSTKSSAAGAQLAAVSGTPAFRNLGKRGESDL